MANQQKINIGVVGAGFVGSAVINGFDTANTQLIIVDPDKSYTTLDQLILQEPPILFICVPTPSASTGEVDVSIVDSILKDLDYWDYKGIVVIKSTITPDHLINFNTTYKLRMVYNPEFLTEANALADFINPSMQILGGEWRDCEEVERIYVQHSKVKIVPTFKTDIGSASLLKYTINSWLATKVTFFNELYQLHTASGAKTTWAQFTDMLTRDSRIGNTHLQVPGPDGKFGFGGHCFPKDTTAFLHYANTLDNDLSILNTAVCKNDSLRKN